MQLIIHRGTHEVGGTCVELFTEHARIIIDLVTRATDPRDQKKRHKNFSLHGKTVPELVREGILPHVSGLYWGLGDEKPVDAVLLSHSHQDHYGLFQYIRRDVPLYLGADAEPMLKAAEVFLGDRPGLYEKKVLLEDRSAPVEIGDMKVTPFPVDPSAYGAMAFLVEAEGKKVFYAGDFRGQGRKKSLLERFVGEPVSGVNVLLMEGTVTGRQDEDTPTEEKLELEIASAARVCDGMKLFICSGQHVDRLVTFYKAAKRCGAIFVLDLYAANVLCELDRKDLPVPTNGFKDVKVLFTNHFMKKLAERHLRHWYERWRPYEIGTSALQRAARKAFVMFRDSAAHEFEAVGIPKGSALFYFVWNQYTMEPSFERTQAFLDRHDIALKEMHASGLAILPDLKRFAKAVDPDALVPIHTVHPEDFREHFGNRVRCLADGECLEI